MYLIVDLVILKFDLVFRNFDLGHSFLTGRGRVFIFHVYSLSQDLSPHTIVCGLVTLKFDLILKNVFLGYDSWVRRVVYVAIYIWLPSVSYVVFLATLVDCHINSLMTGFYTSDEVGCIMVWCGRPSGCLSVGLSTTLETWYELNSFS